jgi:5'-3' exonuclease
MGVQDFSAFLEKAAPQSTFKVPLSTFAGKRIAIDIDNLVYIMLVVVTRQVVKSTNLVEKEPDQQEIHRLTLSRILDRLTTFMYYGIQVVCCFDSEPNPLKNRVKEQRTAKHKKTEDEYESARQALYSADPLFRNAQLTERFAKACQNNIKPGWEFSAHIRNLLSTLGFPVLEAKDYFPKIQYGNEMKPLNGDGEAVAAALCLSGNDYCIAANTTDSDFHVYGGNLAITELETERKVVNGVNVTIHYAIVRSLEAILQQSSYSFDKFRDQCILLGTDYNVRIPGIGPVKSAKLIKDHGSILGIGMSRAQDISILNYMDVLQIFSAPMKRIEPPQVDFDVAKFHNNKGILEIEGLTQYNKIISDLPLVATGEAKVYVPPFVQEEQPGEVVSGMFL